MFGVLFGLIRVEGLVGYFFVYIVFYVVNMDFF